MQVFFFKFYKNFTIFKFFNNNKKKVDMYATKNVYQNLVFCAQKGDQRVCLFSLSHSLFLWSIVRMCARGWKKERKESPQKLAFLFNILINSMWLSRDVICRKPFF